jgi:hypothetical protein
VLSLFPAKKTGCNEKRNGGAYSGLNGCLETL